MFQINDIREKNLEVFYDIYRNQGKVKLVEAIAEGLGRRAYFTLDQAGKIKRKDINKGLYLITTINKENYKEVIKVVIEDMVDLREREIIKKIDRASKYDIKNLIKNFNKILANGERSYALKYGKELFMRDKNLFFKMLFDYVLIENISTKKSIMAYSLYELLNSEENFSDEVFFVGISYIAQRKSEFSNYENLLLANDLEKLEKEELTNKIDSTLPLEVICYNKLLNEFSYEKESLYLNLLNNKLK